jgi:hypothetical protein
MTKTNFVEIVVALDRSGSMSSVRNDTIGGFNTFVSDQRREAKGDVKLTLVQFDDQYEINYNGMPIQDVPPLTEATYIPRGMTALLDAVGKTISTVGDRLAKTPENERPSLVIFVILTDGQENQSKEFKLDQIKTMITHQTEKYNWQFLFLGADQNSFQAESMGFSKSNTYNYANANTADTFSYLSKGISAVYSSSDTCAQAASIGDTMRGLAGCDTTSMNRTLASSVASLKDVIEANLKNRQNSNKGDLV